MLDELTWRDWQEQLAYESIECEPLERIAEILKLGFAAVCQSWGAEVTIDNFEPLASRRSGDTDADGWTAPDVAAAGFNQGN